MALAADRNRRADGPDQGNRCYAEAAPRQRDLVYQADYCYSSGFAACSVFLAWAARNAAEPAYATEAAQRAWRSGIAAPEAADAGASDIETGTSDGAGRALPTPEEGLFGPPDESELAASGRGEPERIDWVSAAAWADAPWDERAEAEAEELAMLEAEDSYGDAEDELDDADEVIEEATVGPKVPAALPMRRRRTRQRPIRTRGSGEWFYSDPLDHEPLVRRRYGITPPILLVVLGLLVVALVLFMVPTLLSGGNDGRSAAAPSASPGSSNRPSVTRAPVVVATPGATADPSPTALPKPRTYRVKSGDSLSGIAAQFGVKPGHLQCINGILNKNIVVLGAKYLIPPEGYVCPPGWRRGATPEPDPEPEPEAPSE